MMVVRRSLSSVNFICIRTCETLVALKLGIVSVANERCKLRKRAVLSEMIMQPSAQKFQSITLEE